MDAQISEGDTPPCRSAGTLERPSSGRLEGGIARVGRVTVKQKAGYCVSGSMRRPTISTLSLLVVLQRGLTWEGQPAWEESAFSHSLHRGETFVVAKFPAAVASGSVRNPDKALHNASVVHASVVHASVVHDSVISFSVISSSVINGSVVHDSVISSSVVHDSVIRSSAISSSAISSSVISVARRSIAR